MTDSMKKELRDGINKLCDNLYNTAVKSFEMVEKDMPSELTEEQKMHIFSSVFQTSLETQKKLLDTTTSDVESKLQDKEFMAKAMKEVNNG
jgi:hypothetical protein